ncbi:MAG: proline iminopeptidase-family hydrolase [Lactobacillaceae bacterium]|jgi:proline iminopeptidase|nr:proline iminopeptidase-family hydrolase [Lactobacillaceae bacterium]
MTSKILTLKNGFHIWTNTVGSNNPIKMITLHGGPGETNEGFELWGEFLKDQDLEITRYDQLGSFYSDQPDFVNHPELAEKYLNIDYFVEELEEIRTQLGYEKFILVGNSWGGMIAQQYALKYQKNLSGLIIMSMTSREADYGEALHEILHRTESIENANYVDQLLADEIYDDERENEILGRMFGNYFGRFDAPRTSHLIDVKNHFVDEYMLGKNPFVSNGTLAGWDVENKVHQIKVPTYLTFGEDDLFAKEKIDLLHKNIAGSTLDFTPNGTHIHSREFPEIFFGNLIKWLEKNKAEFL